MSKKLKVIILCGGFGTRIKSSIGNTPKILAPINQIPFIEYFLKWLDPVLTIDNSQLIFSVHYNYAPILNFIEKHRINCNFTVDSQAYGTFGAVCKAALDYPSDNYLILNGDTIFKADLKSIYEVFLAKNELPLLILKKTDHNDRYGGYKIENGKFILSNNLAEHISLGAYFISNSELINRWQLSTSSEFNFKEFSKFEKFPLLNDNDCLGLEPINGYCLESNTPFIDIGIKESFIRAQKEIPFIIGSYN
ncbi:MULTISPECIES: sugar phosphate nucleotidyltransferase [Prochlorococcus]|uniref:D-glycero-D-manno-heptose 1-phosphate guanosyltransferase n=1 Tax=Prochlorococcus marinus str. MIT 9116 TaxID=167544 RepID=A0A0A1ZXU6_PROMR|nr:sugar phosphate nucleotidyltransferase [Prochlorococcus marinus]KGF91977.1 D-glycero-D-manno-heptose 1-phosphate guanosyltransferase [Prochlorococcus marinus str. MIT 9107]KGF93064.1 D-glycero-D-manno-heptose 1-phosphate guanosyltransferase [Prochlorococcus marinus str. MIT 9116]KGF93978.1 D-glycero-D-manno-heptose 1-phosphate guanosyltransferase [Prochlorococcus marinus str. MIT 9123]